MRHGAGLSFEEEFLPEERLEWEPPERLTISHYSDRHRVLDSASSAEPGPWRTDRTPYLRAIMDAFNDPEVETAVFQSCTQVGKSETVLNILAYIIDQRPGPTMLVYPTVETAEDFSRTRLQPMVKGHKRLRKKMLGDRHLFTTLRMQFSSMDLFLSGANSAASLASKPIEYLLMDEVGKFASQGLGDEADPVSLAMERTKTFTHSRKIFMVSTPTTAAGRITREIEDCDAVYDYHVPCPHCGVFQVLRFQQVKWPEVEKEDPERYRRVEEETCYECPHCKGKVTDVHKAWMLLKGEWREEKLSGRRKKIGFRLSSLYSPWVKFGQMAVMFLRSKAYPEKLQNFVNSWLGEPWEAKTHDRKESAILALKENRPRGLVPSEGVLGITAGIDTQDDCFYYVIRAWGKFDESWLIREGKIEDYDALLEIVLGRFRTSRGRITS